MLAKPYLAMLDLRSLILFFASAASLAPAQSVDFFAVDRPRNRAGHGMAFDAARGQVLAFSGVGSNSGQELGDTWGWDGGRWTLTARRSAQFRRDHVMLADPVRSRVFAVGGRRYDRALRRFDAVRDIVEFDGDEWSVLPGSDVGPTLGATTSAAYDSIRDRIVLLDTCHTGCAGVGGGGQWSTWEWDGVRWLRLTALGPATRSERASLAFDSARGRVVLFGGTVAARRTDETWEWDGSRWTQLNPSQRPPSRRGHELVFDPVRGRVLMLGGSLSSGALANDVWSWDGSNWTLEPGVMPEMRDGYGIAFDSRRGALVLFGGGDTDDGEPRTEGDVWEWDGMAWSRRVGHAQPPSASPLVGLVADIGNAAFAVSLDFGLGTVVWRRDADGWTRASSVGPIGSTSFPSVAFDQNRGRLVLFDDPGGGRGSVHEWDLATDAWSTVSVAAGPPLNAAPAFDPGTGRVMRFGGGATAALSNDTSLWDGQTWVVAQPANRPSPRVGPFIATDHARGRVVLTGGFDGAAQLTDTWEWDGADWTRSGTATTPPKLAPIGIPYPSGGGVLGISDDPSRPTELWRFDGVDWARVPTSRIPPIVDQLGFDPRTGEAIAIDPELGVTWDLAAVRRPASVRRFGNACSGLGAVLSATVESSSSVYIGEAIELLITADRSSNESFVMLGTSARSWVGGALPMSLGSIGMPGCALLIGPELFVPLGPTPTGTSRRLQLTIPPAPSLGGITLFAQGAAFAAFANPAGVVVGSALELRIGLR